MTVYTIRDTDICRKNRLGEGRRTRHCRKEKNETLFRMGNKGLPGVRGKSNNVKRERENRGGLREKEKHREGAQGFLVQCAEQDPTPQRWSPWSQFNKTFTGGNAFTSLPLREEHTIQRCAPHCLVLNPLMESPVSSLPQRVCVGWVVCVCVCLFHCENVSAFLWEGKCRQAFTCLFVVYVYVCMI